MRSIRPKFLQGEIELVLALEGRQPLQHCGRQHGAGLQRGDEAQDLVPVLADDVCPDAAPEQRLQILVGGGGLDAGELAIGEVAQPRAEPKAQHGAQDEHVVRGAAGVGVMRADPQRGAVVHQPIQHVRRFVAGRRHDAHAVGAVLVGDVGVEAEAGIVAVARVDLAGGVAALGRSGRTAGPRTRWCRRPRWRRSAGHGGRR